MLRVLLVACKKASTKKWFKKEISNINDWINLVYNIFSMERITFKLRTQFDIFNENWAKWLNKA